MYEILRHTINILFMFFFAFLFTYILDNIDIQFEFVFCKLFTLACIAIFLGCNINNITNRIFKWDN